MFVSMRFFLARRRSLVWAFSIICIMPCISVCSWVSGAAGAAVAAPAPTPPFTVEAAEVGAGT